MSFRDANGIHDADYSTKSGIYAFTQQGAPVCLSLLPLQPSSPVL